MAGAQKLRLGGLDETFNSAGTQELLLVLTVLITRFSTCMLLTTDKTLSDLLQAEQT